MSKEIAGIILAGGQSSRMGGGDKGLLELDGRSVLAHLVARLEPQVDRLALNANGDASRFAAFGLPVVADTIEGFAGPLAGVLSGLEWASSARLAKAVSAAADTPFVPLDLVGRLSASVDGNPNAIAVACSAGRRHPVFALWPVALRSALARALANGERRVSAFIDAHEHVEVEFSLASPGNRPVDPFFNINTPQDLEEAERMLKDHPR